MKRDLNEIADRSFDVAIVGGGITGAGVARHAALAGLNTVLLDGSDFAAGTSSRSTKLIHGGLRYLAMGHVGLVRETALERKHLFRMAPHLAEPRWMLVPAGSRLELAKLQLGISLYELLGMVASSDRHHNWQAEDLGREEPLLNRALFPYGCAYREYLTDDARLVLATLRAAAAHGARVCNHVRVERLHQQSAATRLECTDTLTGDPISLQAKVVVNATGPWAEQLVAGETARSARLHLSKGVHLGIRRSRLPVRNMVMLTAADGRPVFAIARGSVTYVGTTDTSLEGGPDLWPEVEQRDVDYLLEPLARYFPEAKIRQDDIVSAWAGLRPLVNQPGKAPKEMSRKEEIWRDGRIVTIAGGKLTGFRKMAEQVMAAVGDVLDRDVDLDAPTATLPGGDNHDLAGLMRQIRERYGVDEQGSRRLTRLYGSEVFGVLGEGPTPITPAVFAEEVSWAVDQECAICLEDVVYRRLRIPWFRPEDTVVVAEAAAGMMAQLLSWTPERQRAEREALNERLRHDLTFLPG